MKYLKTSEGLFSKPELPQDLIDDIVDDIATKYEVKVEKEDVSKQKDENILERINIITKTPIGDIKSRLTLFESNPHDVRRSKEQQTKLRKIFSKSIIRFEVFFNGNRYVNDDHDLKDWKNVDTTSVLHNIDYVLRKIQDIKKWEEEEKSYWSKMPSVDEVKDLVADLSDLIGEFHMNKPTSGRGYQISFQSVKGIPTWTQEERQRFRATDRFLEVMKELNSLNKRFEEGYDVKMDFSINAAGNSIIITINANESEPQGHNYRRGGHGNI